MSKSINVIIHDREKAKASLLEHAYPPNLEIAVASNLIHGALSHFLPRRIEERYAQTADTARKSLNVARR
jgi:hypothetical protein